MAMLKLSSQAKQQLGRLLRECTFVQNHVLIEEVIKQAPFLLDENSDNQQEFVYADLDASCR